jgi:hypothetical protein
MDAVLEADRTEALAPPRVQVRPFPFSEWARGAAAVAIQAHVLPAVTPA